MSNAVVKRYTFGEDNSYYYDFTLQTYVVPGNNSQIITVLMSSTNMRNKPTALIDPYIPSLIQFLANICVEHNASYDACHNYLVPYSYDDSSNIADNVHALIQKIRLESSLFHLYS